MLSGQILKLAKFFRFAIIQIPIRDLKNFCLTYPPKLKKELEQVQISLAKPGNVSDEEFEDYFRQIFRFLRPQDLDIWLRYSFKDILDSLNAFERLCRELNANTQIGNFYDYFNYLIHRMEYLNKDLEKFLEKIERELSEDQFHSERYEYYLEYPEENIAQGEIYFNLIDLPKKLKNLILNFNYYYLAVKEKFRMFQSNYHGREDEKPDNDVTEILYHTTVNADTIFANGFLRDESKMEGLGGSSETRSGKKSISFTADLHIAKEIARCLKEAIMIANGEIDCLDILEWADNPEKIKKSYSEIYGDLNYDKAEDCFNLYRIYLAYAKRYDPVFFSTASEFISIFKGKNPKDVGIIIAKVDMTNKDISYLQAMLEYRVPAEAVISIEKVIK